MITEDYVSFETAKLLKKKGFDEKCYKVWETHGGSSFLVGAPQFVEGETVVDRESVDAAAKQYVYEYSLINNVVEGYLAPTLQMAMKWLREVHNIFIAINMIPDTIQKPYFFKPYVDKKIYNFPLDYSVEFYTTYEEACEAAIKYCLENLI